jgi:nucleoid DNA-binding protein
MRNYKHSKVVKEISEKLNVHPNVVNIVIRSFFNGLRNILKRNENVHIKGYFRITMKPAYKRRLEKLKKLSKSTNLRGRKHKKRY